MIDRKKIARHARSFGRYQKIEHPSHREKLLERTPHGKYERMYLLMANMGKEIASFLAMAESEGEDRLQVAHGLFRLLLGSSKEMLLSAVREANASASISSDISRASFGPGGRKKRRSIPRTPRCSISPIKKES